MRAPARFSTGTALVAALAVALAPLPGLAETLQEALEQAYRSNPDLAAARSGLRVTDEGVAIAAAAGRPTVGATTSYTENVLQVSRSGGTGTSFSLTPDRSAIAGAQLTVPIYQGGSVKNSVRAAETRVQAGRANLRATESSVFSQVVAAYMDVIRDESIVELNRSNVGVLQVNLRATRDRFQIGDVTRTDVAQSEARLSLAQANLETARANLIRSKETYVQVVGSPPDNLQPPPPLPNLPSSPDQATQIALGNNPDLAAARQAVTAARYDVQVARAGRLPSLSTVTGINYTNYLGSISVPPGVSLSNGATTGQVGIQASIPIFQGGRVSARIRQAQELVGQAEERAIGVERVTIAQTRASYSAYQAAQEVIVSSQRAVSANQLSLEGVRAENTVGNRTILDILNAEQELLNSQVTLVTARRNAYVAGFTLLAAMGRAEARDLGLDGGTLYDPAQHYGDIRGRWGDWGPTPEPSVQATRTVDTPAQTAPITPLPPD